MGCFSFKCKKCGTGINSSSFEGEHVHMFLMEDGKVIEQMSGEYNSYGRVFIDNTQDSTVSHKLRKSQEWSKKWSEVCNLMFNDNPNSGIAAIHTTCMPKGYIPKTTSDQDPNQGWGKLRKKHTEITKLHKVLK